MGPLLWWWRWWTGVEPNRDKALVEARESIEREQARVQQLSSEHEVKDTQITALQKQLNESDGELRQLRTRLTELEGDDGQLPRLRARIDELERTAAEADRLRTRVDELEQTAAEADRLRTRVDELEQTAAEADRLRSQVDELRAELADSTGPRAARTPDAGDAEPDAGEPDVSEAAPVLGTRVKLDDFTMIEGIGPKIAELLDGAGITTWRILSDTDPAELRRVLTEAGPRFRLHDPTNWPAQAALLTHGRWQEFKELTTKLREQRGG